MCQYRQYNAGIILLLNGIKQHQKLIKSIQIKILQKHLPKNYPSQTKFYQVTPNKLFKLKYQYSSDNY